MPEEYVYMLSNTSPEFNGIYKIGKTKKHPEVRADELGKATGTLGKFIVEWFIEVPNCDLAEKIIHDLFKANRIYLKKEFFRVDLDDSIKKAEIAINDFFKPIGNSISFRRSEITKRKFGKTILDNEDVLKEWWSELPIEFKHRVLDCLSDSEEYLRLHIENYITENHWTDIRIRMLSRNVSSFDDYPIEWKDEPHYAFQHIFDKDNFYITEMLLSAAYEDWWWFAEIFSFEHQYETIEFSNLKKMFSKEEISLKNDEINNSISDTFPYLKKIKLSKSSSDTFVKLARLKDMELIDLGIVEIIVDEVIMKKFRNEEDWFYPEKNINQLRTILEGIKSIKSAKTIEFELGIGSIDDEDGSIIYYVTSQAWQQMKPVILKIFPLADIKKDTSFIKIRVDIAESTPSV